MQDKINMSFQCDSKFSAQIKRAAKNRGQSAASYIRFAVIRMLAHDEEQGNGKKLDGK